MSSPAPVQSQRKKTTYGKSNSRLAYNSSLFNDVDGRSHVKGTRVGSALQALKESPRKTGLPKIADSPHNSTTQSGATQPSNASTGKLPSRSIRPSRKADPFEVPSTDEEDNDEFVTVPALPTLKKKRLISDAPMPELTQWEKKHGADQSVLANGRAPAKSPLSTERVNYSRSGSGSELSLKEPVVVSRQEMDTRPLSAAARLAARKRMGNDNTETAEVETRPHKRVRVQSEVPGQHDLDFIDVPVESFDHATAIQSKIQNHPVKRRMKAERRTETFPIKDTDTPEARSRSTSPGSSRKSTPHRYRQTTPKRSFSPESTPAGTLGSGQRAKTVTPKQAMLWTQLLPSDGPAPSPSALRMRQLHLAENDKPAPAQQQRPRLVDRLKALQQSSDSESEEDSVSKTYTKTTSTTDGPPQSRRTHKQSTSANNGPRITYSSMRTYLNEAISFEDELVTSFSNDDPALAKKSAFDLSESDEDSGAGKFRNIHELRAAGRSIRAMEDIEGLMRDIANHSATNKSRRRSALIELAVNLTDKAFAERFLSHGFADCLKAECADYSDRIADFAVASSVALIASEAPEHTLKSLQPAMQWLCTLLPFEEGIDVFPKDRANDMSTVKLRKSLDGLMKSLRGLWGVTKLSLRVAALRALDFLTRSLRRLGERTALLDNRQLAEVAYGFDETAVSLLESLSMGASDQVWPEQVVKWVSSIITSAQAHMLFLALRLTLNLTNDNARNCDLLATEHVIHSMMRLVQDGFAALSEPEDHTLRLDLIVLAMGVLTNLCEQAHAARVHLTSNAALLSSILATFTTAQERAHTAESVEESASNVAFGYLAVLLAHACSSPEARTRIASGLPGSNLDLLIQAVDEFVKYHMRVDMAGLAGGDAADVGGVSFEGQEGREVWAGFTEKLRRVLQDLKTVARG